MNKKVILKYKDVFDWWLNGGAVWHKNFEWCLDENPSFDSINSTYVQDDEYAEFRKALADGETVQFLRTHIGAYPINPAQWLDWNSYGSCFDENTEYRIKPDEPKFKVGDWVRIDDPVTMSYICKFRKDTYRVFEGDLDCIIKWKPQDGDVIICLDQPTPRIFKVNGTNMRFINDEFRKKRIIPYIGQPLEEMK